MIIVTRFCFLLWHFQHPLPRGRFLEYKYSNVQFQNKKLQLNYKHIKKKQLRLTTSKSFIVYIVVNSWCLQTQKIQKKLKWTFDGFYVRISKWDFLLRSNLRELQRTLQASCCKMDGSVGIVLKICIRRTPYLNKSKKGLELPF